MCQAAPSLTNRYQSRGDSEPGLRLLPWPKLTSTSELLGYRWSKTTFITSLLKSHSIGSLHILNEKKDLIRITQNVFHFAYRRFLTFVHVERVRTLQVPFVSDRLFQKRCHFYYSFSFLIMKQLLNFKIIFPIIMFTNLRFIIIYLT